MRIICGTSTLEIILYLVTCFVLGLKYYDSDYLSVVTLVTIINQCGLWSLCLFASLSKYCEHINPENENKGAVTDILSTCICVQRLRQ